VTGDYLRLFGAMPPALRYVAAFVERGDDGSTPAFGRVTFG
jgi:hypothetical protein